jgi:serine protease Do
VSGHYRDSTVRRLVQEQDVVSDENSREKLQNVLVDSTAGSESPAQVAGIQVGDVIMGWNESPVSNSVQLGRLIAQSAIGSSAKVRIVRDRQTINLQVVIKERTR